MFLKSQTIKAFRNPSQDSLIRNIGPSLRRSLFTLQVTSLHQVSSYYHLQYILAAINSFFMTLSLLMLRQKNAACHVFEKLHSVKSSILKISQCCSFTSDLYKLLTLNTHSIWTFSHYINIYSTLCMSCYTNNNIIISSLLQTCDLQLQYCQNCCYRKLRNTFDQSFLS